jgi:hypothetical protein
MTFPCDCFYNSTSLNGQTLLDQWYRVVCSCEAIGRKVLGTSCNAGGGNASFFSAFRKWKKIAVKDCWISEESIKAPHPFDPRRWTFLWHCTTHLMKSVRNALYNSKPDGPRLFHDLNDVPFGWATIQTLWASDHRFHCRKTLLSDSAINLSGWSKMNVQYAKAPFQDKTLAELYKMVCEAFHLSEMELDKLERAAKSKPALITWKRTSKKDDNEIVEGLFVARIKHLRLLVDEKESERVEVSEVAKQDLATLEFSAIVHDIFLTIFMNRTIILTEDNIDEIEVFLKYCMQILSKWKMMHILRRPVADVTKETADATESTLVKSQEKPRKSKKMDVTPQEFCEKEFLAHQTWRNLQITVRGFIEYPQCVLKTEQGMNRKVRKVWFVPVLHSNTTNLEGVFSVQRMRKCDNAQTYANGIARATANPKMAKTAARNSGQYEHNAEDQDTIYMISELPSKDAGRKMKACEKQQTEWITRIDVIEAALPKTTSRALQDGWLKMPRKLVLTDNIVQALQRQFQQKSYLGHLSSTETFVKSTKLATSLLHSASVLSSFPK